MDIGFVGLGNMGGPMAANLLKAGHRVYVRDLSDAAVERAVAAGAVVVENPRAAAEAGEMVLTSLPTPAAVEAVYLGPDGLLEGAREGQLFFDLSTITPSLARELSRRFAEKGAAMLDAPVSGGVAGATAGTLAIMVGGDEDALRKAEPVLRDIGKNIFYAGPVGSSSTVKMFNQLLVGVTNAAVVELVALARRTGIDLG
ncbi:MAG TPA: NAD(P)-dependent oxidoreductase, partial [Chloroflexota bacterium]|nr:NAD(P)-dependent oxidoreductase [Chloroflexota bacterium]